MFALRRLAGTALAAGGPLVVAFVVLTPRISLASLEITRWSVDGGGSGFKQVGPFVYGGSIGQPDAGHLVAGTFSIDGGFWVPRQPVPLDAGPPSTPGRDVPVVSFIHDATPNPTFTRTRIEFALAEEGAVDIRVFDVTGALLAVLEAGRLPAGRHGREWSATDAAGRRVSPGIYLALVRLPGMSRSLKLVVLR